MAQLKQTTAYNRAFLLVQSADHISGLTGATPVVQGSKNGGSFTTLTAVVSELGNGYYNAALKTSDTATLGDLAFHITAASADPTDFIDQIVAFDPADAVRLGLTALPNVASGSAGAIPTTGTGANQISVTNGLVSLNSSQTVQAGSVLDKSGYSLTQSFPANFAALAITAGGAMTVGTNNDKTGYSLSQSFPANFASQLIDSGGHVTASSSSSVLVSGTVTVGTNNDKTGYALTPQERGLVVASTWTTVQSESYSAKAAVPTPAQTLFQMQSLLAEKAVAQTSVSFFQVDGATVWGVYTLDSTSPTTIHRNA